MCVWAFTKQGAIMVSAEIFFFGYLLLFRLNGQDAVYGFEVVAADDGALQGLFHVESYIFYAICAFRSSG